MLGKVLFDAMRKVITNVQKQNEDDPEVKTADTRVFEEMSRKVEEAEANVPETSGQPTDIFDMMREKMKQTQVENERDPEVETADVRVFDNLLKEIERLKEKVETEVPATPEVPKTVPGDILTSNMEPGAGTGMMMKTNSGGGSLALRLKPDMGSPVNSVRVPHQSAVRILNQSNKSIRLDGQVAHWIEVEYDGQIGWILDTYLK
jgi:hypothetical protein